MAADGSKQRRVTHDPHDDLSANWSPDSTQLIFESNRAGDYNLYEMTLAGTNVAAVDEQRLGRPLPQLAARQALTVRPCRAARASGHQAADG